MKSKKYLFVGNRFSVLEQMIKKNLSILQIFAVKDSYLEIELKKREIKYKTLHNKELFLKELQNFDFDILISNGCPYVIPVSQIKKTHQLFINIHPSLLPDLKGKHPINGAFLFNKKAGASCHHMNDGIDEGNIIYQIEIPLSKDLDLGLLYKLSFIAEADVFLEAYKRNFVTIKKNKHNKGIYYSRKNDDLKINFKQDINQIIRKIKAFGIKSQGAYFVHKKVIYKVIDAEKITNKYLLSKLSLFKDFEIVFIYENNIIVKKNDAFLKLKCIIGNLNFLKIGNKLK